MTLEDWFEKLADIDDLPHVHNLFSRQTEDGRRRLNNLRTYMRHALENNPRVLLVGEAPGYQGTYRTGVPFTSEAILLGPVNKFGIYGGTDNGYERVYEEERIWKEPSATVVQKVINDLPELPLIWATFPLHPHKPGVELSNRAPNTKEVALGAELLRELIAILEPERVIAVGNIAEKCLTALGFEVEKVRHPSHGGATQFREQLIALMG
jgi:hypothetical protein